jgi:hypothetical protein
MANGVSVLGVTVLLGGLISLSILVGEKNEDFT